MTGPCDHGRGHDGNRTSTLASRELTRYIVIYVLSKQLDHDDHQLYHSLNVSYAGVNISGLIQCWFWRELSQEVTRVSKCFPFDILIDTLISDTIYRSNLKYRFSIYIAYRYATLPSTTGSPHKGPVVWGFDDFFVVMLNKLWEKNSACWLLVISDAITLMRHGCHFTSDSRTSLWQIHR